MTVKTENPGKKKGNGENEDESESGFDEEVELDEDAIEEKGPDEESKNSWLWKSSWSKKGDV